MPLLGMLRVLAMAIAASPCAARTITDGDTLKQGGVTYRLWGIDAPEAKQVCPDGWPAGSLATTRLQALTAGRSIVCQEKDRDRYGRVVAICRVSGEDLGAILVREGFAWAFTRYSIDYIDQQEEARRANRGVQRMTAYRRGSGERNIGQPMVARTWEQAHSIDGS
ncbi:nuclease homologue [Rhodospirillales bacterium URHD0017]|nr:nuclease homologue [Rhodospirillales bacterium URHD0017]